MNRCVVCRQYTLAQPLLHVRGWRMHLPACIDCMTSESVDLGRHVVPIHRALAWVLWCLLVTGQWCWSL